jgi:hypothetical protein
MVASELTATHPAGPISDVGARASVSVNVDGQRTIGDLQKAEGPFSSSSNTAPIGSRRDSTMRKRTVQLDHLLHAGEDNG